MLKAFFAMLCVYVLIIVVAQAIQMLGNLLRWLKTENEAQLDVEDCPALNED